MKKLLGSFAILALATPFAAQAADLPVAPAYKAPVIAPVVYSWTGCYIGGNLGGKWEAHRNGSVSVPAATGAGGASPASVFTFDDGSSSTNGSFVGGGQVGCNYQTGQFVFGIEGDLDWNHLTDSAAVGTTAPLLFVAGDSFSWVSRWQASVRGRVGYAWDRTLLYATGGVAFTNVSLTSNFIPIGIFPGTVASDQQTLTGATVGGGFEYAFTNNLSFGVEGRYTWYGSQTFNTGALSTSGFAGGPFTFAPTTTSLKLNTAEVLAKVNWKFGPW
jgi:outer membrane immunogenic protein